MQAVVVSWLKQFGKVTAILIFIGWLGAWFFLSDADTRSVEWTKEAALGTTVDMGFKIENILVEGRVNTDVDVLKGLLNAEKGDPLFAFNPREARDLVERIAWIRSARVERRWPDTVYVELEERRPLALWQKDKKLKLIDERGDVITDYNLARFEDLIVVVGDRAWAQAPVFLAVLAAEPEIEKRVESASWIGNRRWDLKLKEGTVVKLPENDTDFALRRLAMAHAEDNLLDLDVKAIDLREPEKIVIRSAPGEAQEYKAGLKL